MESITFDTLRTTTPAVFSKNAAPNRSNKYVFVSTEEILEKFQLDGWGIVSAKQNGKGIYNSHEIRLRNDKLPKMVGDCFMESIINNSHNGTKPFSVSTGVFRLVCGNGLTVPTALSRNIKVRHMNFELNDVREITDSFAQTLPFIEKSMTKMMNRHLNDDEKIAFMQEAINIRWKEGKVPETMDLSELLQPNRISDNNSDMWSVFNVLQEKFIRGGIQYTTNNNRRNTMRELKNFNVINDINTQLWELAETYC
jgi:hypothetical protein